MPAPPYWVLVCNPRRWAIDRFIREELPHTDIDEWGVRPVDAKNFHPGQRAIVRVGQDRRPKAQLGGAARLEPGIYALCEILSEPYPGTGANDKYWSPDEARGTGWPTVKVRYLSSYLQKPLLIETLSKIQPGLNRHLLKGLEASSFPISESDFKFVERHLTNPDRPALGGSPSIADVEAAVRPRRLLVKRLVPSELILFKSLYRVRTSMLGLSAKTAQKAISPPADLLRILFPQLAEIWAGRVDLNIYGPGMRGKTPFPDRSLRRQDKNWRIEGDIDDQPLGSPYRVLRPDDYVVLDFCGNSFPTEIDLYLLSATMPQDVELLRAVRFLHHLKGGKAGYLAGADELLTEITADKVPEGHPLLGRLVGAEATALEEDAAQGDTAAAKKLRRTGRRMSAEQFRQMKLQAAATGRKGEALVDQYLKSLHGRGIKDHEWVADKNPGSPYDFEIVMKDGSRRRWEVKSTSGGGALDFCMSQNELAEAVDGQLAYDLIRVSGIKNGQPVMRTARNARHVFRRLRDAMKFPDGVSPGDIWIAPRLFKFDAEIDLSGFAEEPTQPQPQASEPPLSAPGASPSQVPAPSVAVPRSLFAEGQGS